MIETVYNKGNISAIIIRNGHESQGIEFVTPDSFSQQLAYMHHPKGHTIIPHFHNRIGRTVYYTQEVLVIKRGRVKVNFYDEECAFLSSAVILTGDIILLASGGHGFEVEEDTEMIEIKQGPYAGEADKTRFNPR